MSANIAPIFSKLADVQGSVWISTTTANVKSDGTGTIGTDMLVAFLADATNGGFIDRIRFMPSASVASTAMTQSMIRVYISSITSGATARTNTFLFGEYATTAPNADQATTTAMTPVEITLGFAIPPGYTVLWSMHHAAASNTSWQAIAIGGKY